MPKVDSYRLDWRSEFKKLSPYLEGHGGVIRVEYESEEAAPGKLNYFLKEDFGKPDNHLWQSMRIDGEWFTTRKVTGILDEFERLLAAVGFQPEEVSSSSPALSIISDNDVDGDLKASIENVSIYQFGGAGGKVLRARVAAICDAMKGFVDAGGYFMVVINDAQVEHQTDFWQQIWHAGLAEAGGDGLLLVVHAGPKANRNFHQDCPDANERIVLPHSVETDEGRCNHIFDDLVDVFSAEEIENPHIMAKVHLENFKSSMLQLHMRLSTSILAAKVQQGE